MEEILEIMQFREAPRLTFHTEDCELKKSITFAKLCKKGTFQEVVDFMRKSDVDANELVSMTNSPRVYSPLIFACRELNFDVIDCLLENGADPNFKTEDNFTPLMAVVEGSTKDTEVRSLACARMLVESGAVVMGKHFLHKRNLVTATVLKNMADLLEYFLLEGADPQERDGLGETPLNVSIAQNFEDVALCLYEFGINPFLKNVNGDGPFDVYKKAATRDPGFRSVFSYWQMKYRRDHFGEDYRAFVDMLSQVNSGCATRRSCLTPEPALSETQTNSRSPSPAFKLDAFEQVEKFCDFEENLSDNESPRFIKTCYVRRLHPVRRAGEDGERSKEEDEVNPRGAFNVEDDVTEMGSSSPVDGGRMVLQRWLSMRDDVNWKLVAMMGLTFCALQIFRKY